MFTGHKNITDTSKPTGFEQYLLVETGYGECREAFGLDDDTPLDLDALLSEIYVEHNVTTQRSMCGPDYAAIITDSRAPDSVVVWTSCDFYLE